MKNIVMVLILIVIGMMNVGCDTPSATFSILPQTDVYRASANFTPRKIDILWVVDNSGSMATSQANVANNFNSFIQRFSALNYDFHMAVTTTDAYLPTIWPNQSPNPHIYDSYAMFRDGGKLANATGGGTHTTHSGVFVLDGSTPNLIPTFMTNITQGSLGYWDERAFDSFRTTLSFSANDVYQFRRPDAFLAVIIVGDEDDHSYSGTAALEQMTSNIPAAYPVQDFVNFLMTYTGSAVADEIGQNFTVSAINVDSEACRLQLELDGFTGRTIGTRMNALADATGGIKSSLCGNFADSLTLISDSIITASAVFALSRTPIVASIKVAVDGIKILNDPANGWTYRASDNSIIFHGTSIPKTGAQISLDFDPLSVKI